MPDELNTGGMPNVNEETLVTDAGEPQVPETWDAYIETQPDAVRTLFQGHVSGLRSALESEREQRTTFQRQLRDVAKQLEDGSQAKADLQALTERYEEAERRAAFYESAPADLVNGKLGWMAANELQAFDRRGNVNWDVIKQAYPDLFRAATKKAAPPANAGNGAGEPPAAEFNMNDAIRKAANRNRI